MSPSVDDATAVKPNADQSDTKEQHRHDDVIRVGQPRRKPNAPSTTASNGVAQQIAASAAPITPVAMRERSFIKDQPLSADG